LCQLSIAIARLIERPLGFLSPTGSVGQVSGRRLVDRVSDPVIAPAGRVEFGSSCCFLSWERRNNGYKSGVVPIK
jgi:hypothetical protein